MGFPDRVAIATKNDHKVREIQAICFDWPVTWVTNADRPWADVPETGEGYLDNALLKARAVAATTGVPAIADDSGIEVDALGGEPGPRSARFAGPGATDERNLRLLIERIRAIPAAARTARYRCAAACAWPDGREVSAQATCEGSLILEPRGSGGFGYDPIFVPDQGGDLRTMAELTSARKHAISHRGKAFRLLRREISIAPAS